MGVREPVSSCVLCDGSLWWAQGIHLASSRGIILVWVSVQPVGDTAWGGFRAPWARLLHEGRSVLVLCMADFPAPGKCILTITRWCF